MSPLFSPCLHQELRGDKLSWFCVALASVLVTESVVPRLAARTSRYLLECPTRPAASASTFDKDRQALGIRIKIWGSWVLVSELLES